MYAKVIVPLPLPPLTYKVPETLQLRIGSPVKVAVRKKILDAVVSGFTEKLDGDYEAKEILAKSDEFPELRPEVIDILLWISEYYHYPAGEVLNSILPPDAEPRMARSYRISPEASSALESIRGKKQRILVESALENGGLLPEPKPEDRSSLKKLLQKGIFSEEIKIDSTVPETMLPPDISSPPPELRPEQAKAYRAIEEAMSEGKFECFLLEGITGSGKTEVYLRAAEWAVKSGKSALVVVPEISLTPQLVDRFKRRIGQPIAVLHSGLSDGERSRQWHLLNQGVLKVCIGARSAALAPIANLGIIIVDEEHESALKQEDRLRYHARDVSVVRAKAASCPIVLGSATPSLESFYNARTGKYRHLLLSERATGGTLPEVIIVDQAKQSSSELIGPMLTRAMQDALAKMEQIMLLLNRRGYSSFLLCSACGTVPECPNCSVSLTHYKKSGALKCHYCGYRQPTPKSCAKCESESWNEGTEGTEALEEYVRNRFPNARVLRIDRESMERKGAMERALESIGAKEVDIIIGTQIIAKGHDFPNISVVGVLNADTSFHLPDFRASEKSFQLFTQMAGRAGRGAIPGKVILQTYNPQHPSVFHTLNHDFRAFAESELKIRAEFAYPPFARLARILVTAPTDPLAEHFANLLADQVMKLESADKIQVVGPSPAVLSKIQNKFRWHVILKSRRVQDLQLSLRSLLHSVKGKIDRRVSLQVDVDPVSLM